MPINEFRSVATFAKTAELGSLRRAASAQGMTPQAASQALAQLELHLGVRLFHRTTRSMSLTDEGRLFLEMAGPALISMQRALEMTRRAKDGISGPLRIVGPRSTFQPALWPVINEFCRRHPDVMPDVELDDRIGNWVEDRVDVGFRVGASPAEGVVARRLLPLQLIICAAPSYVAKYGAPKSLAELGEHRCSAFRHPGTGKIVPWYVKTDGGIAAQEVAAAIFTNVEELELETIIGGHAIGQLSGLVAASHIRAGRLIPLLVEHAPDHLSLFIYYGNRTSQPARARAFIDLAVELLADNPSYVVTAEELAVAESEGRKKFTAR
jgi:DNA-binding transcriptional LysR family regulator